jgi:phosphoesterase RecJ-like protein
MRELITQVKEAFVVDHHEPTPHSALTGITDSSAAATCELAVEAARADALELDRQTAQAAYAGLVYDTGFFAYSKTTRRTFMTALSLIDAGVSPNEIFQQVSENAAIGALLLQKRVLSTLELHHQGRVAAQVLRKEDLAAAGARFEDAEGFINIPMRVKEIMVSILVKETPEGKVRCSLRSKGKVNVSKIAQDFGGGGHISAAGFKSCRNIEETLKAVIIKVNDQMDNI